MSGTKRAHALTAAVAGAAALALALAACSSSTSSSGGVQGGFAQATTHNGIAAIAAGHRPDAPDVTGTTLDGRPVQLADYRGKVVVLNLWGSWCDPCRREAKGLEEIWTKYQGQGVQFLGINTRDADAANAIAFEREKGVTFPSIFDPAGTQLLKFPKGTLNPQFIPTTIVVDRDGKLAARAFGGQSQDAVESMLTPVLAEPSG
ncbi:TlpA family protein disulfide reductase [Kitasatospora sp. NPDC056783]|uniref:TlpA family protein disulfide reductase n=1 Tax=Kitasatospora sp. NPDC056783 TaxID=3345943 RepID=UPI0036C975A2